MNYNQPPQTTSRLLSHISVTVFMLIFAFCAIAGNVFVLFWRRQRRLQENKVQSILLGNLAVSDLLMGIYLIIIAVADITIGDDINPNNIEVLEFSYTCIIAGVSAMLSSEASVFFITLISIDRYICIRFPYTTRKLSKKSTIFIVLFVWIVCLVWSTVPYVYFFVVFHPDKCIGLPISGYELHAAADVSYVILLVFLVNLVCFLIILICYVEIIRAVRKSSREAGRSRSQDMEEQVRLSIRVAAVVATDFCCWIPLIIIGILGQSGLISLKRAGIATIATFLMPLNSAINPFLYTIAYVIGDWRKRKREREEAENRLS